MKGSAVTVFLLGAALWVALGAGTAGLQDKAPANGPATGQGAAR